MGIRETINKNPAATMAVAGVAALLALFYIGYQIKTIFFPSAPDIRVATKAFFTVDDGATTFVDDLDKIPPFPGPGGKEAVRARVYKCPDGRQIVGHLERYTKEGKAKLEQLLARDPKARWSAERQDIEDNHREFKRPKVGTWVKSNSPAGIRVAETPQCSTGQYAVEIMPEE